MNPVPTDTTASAKPAGIAARRGGLALVALLTPQEARLLAAILGLLLLGVTFRFFHLRGEKSVPLPQDAAPSRLIRSPAP